MIVIYYVMLFNDIYSVLLTDSIQSLALLTEFEKNNNNETNTHTNKTSCREFYSPKEMNSANFLTEHGSTLLSSSASRKEPRSGQCLACSFAENPA